MSIGVLYQSRSPHIRSPKTTSSIMREVIFALIPVVIFASFYFGIRVLLIVSLSVLSAVLTEFFFEFVFHRKITIGDFSAVVTGLIFALMLPVTVPWWIPLAGSFFAVAVVKQAFGGIGRNYVNPALFTRMILMLVFPEMLRVLEIDGMSVPTPLACMVEQTNLLPSRLSCFLGVVPGSIGETSSLLLLMGGIYLILRGIVDFRIPFAYLCAALVTGYLFHTDGIYQLITGGLMFSAFFVATDYTTSPITAPGRWIYGFGCGILTIVFRQVTGFPEGICFAVLSMNLLRLILDRLVVLPVYGFKKQKTENK